MILQKNIRSKMEKTQALLDHPVISQHIPEVAWYNSTNLEDMLAHYRSIYIKPDRGRQGNRIIRLKRTDEIDWVLSLNGTSKIMPQPDIPSELESIMVKKKYIIQQGVDMATYNKCPFDIRMVLHKPYETWDLTLTSAKVAFREDAVVTNVAKGARDYPLIKVLRNYDQKKDPMATLRDLVSAALQVCNMLGSKFPLRIIGLDMAVDKKGKIWFIEANTQPQCARLKRLNDKSTRKRYKEAINKIASDVLQERES